MIRVESPDLLTLSWANGKPKQSRRSIVTLNGQWTLQQVLPDHDPLTQVELELLGDGNTAVHFIADYPIGDELLRCPVPSQIKLQRKRE